MAKVNTTYQERINQENYGEVQAWIIDFRFIRKGLSLDFYDNLKRRRLSLDFKRKSRSKLLCNFSLFGSS